MEASVATSSQGAPAAEGTAGVAAGQGQAQSQPTAADKGGGFNWGLFPDVPEIQRELLEPHLRGVQGHVTQMEQRYAPYAPLLDMVTGDDVQNLVGFLQGYSQDPMATLIGMAQTLQQEGSIPASVSIDALRAMLTGEAQQAAQQPGIAPVAPQQGEEIPAWAQQMQQRFEQMDTQAQQQAQAEQEAQQEQLLQQANGNIRSQLTQAGIGEDLVTDQMIVSAIIANNGDELAAATMLQNMRDNFLSAFTNGKTSGGQPPRVEGQLPQTPKGSGRRSAEGKSWDAAKAGARQMLEQQMSMGA